MKSCFFHYSQCIWRKIQKLGLATTYRDNDNVRLFVRRTAVLPLVKPELVEDVWFNALEDRELPLTQQLSPIMLHTIPDPDIDRWSAATQVKEVHKNRQQADNTQTPILVSRTYRPRLRRPRHIASPHGNSTVV